MNKTRINIVTITKEDTSTANSLEIIQQTAFETTFAAEVFFGGCCSRVRAEINDSGFEDFEEKIYPDLVNREREHIEEMGLLTSESESACIRYTVTWNRIDMLTEEKPVATKMPDTLYVQILAMGIAGGVEIVKEDNLYKDVNSDFAFDMTAPPNATALKHAWKTANGGIGLRLIATDGEYYTVYSDFRDTFSAPIEEE